LTSGDVSVKMQVIGRFAMSVAVVP